MNQRKTEQPEPMEKEQGEKPIASSLAVAVSCIQPQLEPVKVKIRPFAMLRNLGKKKDEKKRPFEIIVTVKPITILVLPYVLARLASVLLFTIIQVLQAIQKVLDKSYSDDPILVHCEQVSSESTITHEDTERSMARSLCVGTVDESWMTEEEKPIIIRVSSEVMAWWLSMVLGLYIRVCTAIMLVVDRVMLRDTSRVEPDSVPDPNKDKKQQEEEASNVEENTLESAFEQTDWKEVEREIQQVVESINWKQFCGEVKEYFQKIDWREVDWREVGQCIKEGLLLESDH